MMDLLEASRTGRLLSYDLNTGELTSHMEGLFFANGVALGPDERFVLVNETVTGRVHRLWLKGDRRGEKDIFIDGLPAMVDNISFNGSDTFWVASPNPREALDALADKPLLRKIVGGLPAWVVQTIETPFSMVSSFDVNGQLITSLRDPSALLNQVTSVNECDGQLILGSLVSRGIGLAELDNGE
jgi:sugar lactone lactonase YvrE